MPATVIGSAEWNTRGIVLSGQTAQEQVNGLVNVQVEYAIPASKQYQIDRMFYVDAPPPIWPTVVNRAEMLTNNLYMVQRSISRGNGLVTVNAEYVSGLKRAGFNGYFLKTQKEPNKSAVGYMLGPVPTGPFPPGYTGITIFRTSLGDFTVREIGFFSFELITRTYEFVQIGEATAVRLPKVTRNDLMQIQGGEGQYLWTAQKALSAPIHVIGDKTYYAENYASEEFQRSSTESPQHITPSVKIIERQFTL